MDQSKWINHGLLKEKWTEFDWCTFVYEDLLTISPLYHKLLHTNQALKHVNCILLWYFF